MVREGEGDEEGIVEQQRPSFVQDFKEAGLVNACEKQWHRTVTHMNAYPYVWASYFVVYGGFGIYFAYQWRQLRKAENHVLRLQRELVNKMQQEEDAVNQALRESQQTPSTPSAQLQPNSTPPPRAAANQHETKKAAVKA
jgi:hypothetical protein